MTRKLLNDNNVSNNLKDKFFILTNNNGEEYKVSYKDLLPDLGVAFLQKYLKSKIGNLYINNNNKYINKEKFDDDYFEYLMLNGQTITKNEYPDLFSALNIEEDTYTLPNYWQEEGGCTLKHISEGSGRELNSYEKDEVKSHSHALELNTIETEPFDIDLAHGHRFSFAGGIGGMLLENNEKQWTSGVFTNKVVWDKNLGNNNNDVAMNVEINEIYLNVDQFTGESTKPKSDPINVKVKPYSGVTNLEGHKENTVKNMAVQFYIIAKVIAKILP